MAVSVTLCFVVVIGLIALYGVALHSSKPMMLLEAELDRRKLEVRSSDCLFVRSICGLVGLPAPFVV
jgi:hypothetical protein